MRLEIRVQNNMGQWTRHTREVSRLRTALLITGTARHTEKHLRNKMRRQIHKPTPFTMRGLRSTPARRSTLTAWVYVMPIQARYLKWTVFGGQSSEKKPVPTTRAKNKYGNLPRGTLKRRKGVFKRGKKVFQRRGRRVQMIAVWSDSRHYRKRWDFYGIAVRESRRYMRMNQLR